MASTRYWWLEPDDCIWLVHVPADFLNEAGESFHSAVSKLCCHDEDNPLERDLDPAVKDGSYIFGFPNEVLCQQEIEPLMREWDGFLSLMKEWGVQSDEPEWQPQVRC